MRLNQWLSFVAAGLVFASNSVFAEKQPLHEQIQVPQCLASKINFAHQVLAADKQFQIIDLSSKDIDSLARLADQVQCGRFINISHKLSNNNLADQKKSATLLLKNNVKSLKAAHISDAIYEIKHQDDVNAALQGVVPDNIWQTLTHLTGYKNRSATKDTGLEAANWLKSQFEAMAVQYGRTDTNTFFVETGWYKQPSLVTVIGKDIQAPAVVIGAHMDTLDGRMPGAGDDGSGSSVNYGNG